MDTTRLILTRRAGQSIYVGETRVKVETVKGAQVKLVIEAPRAVKILREELKARAA